MTSPEGTRTLLKRDLFGCVARVDPADGDGSRCLERDTTAARVGLRFIARRLAAREALALDRLANLEGVPRLLQWDARRLVRSWIEGQPMQVARPCEAAYYREALRLVRRLHAAGVTHNDLAKEPNWLVTPDGRPALVDFQLAAQPRYRGRRFRAQAYDDVRHLLKHKRTYRPQALTARERTILARRSWPAELWMRIVKPVYRSVTRGLLGWADREGAGDRGTD